MVVQQLLHNWPMSAIPPFALNLESEWTTAEIIAYVKNKAEFARGLHGQAQDDLRRANVYELKWVSLLVRSLN